MGIINRQQERNGEINRIEDIEGLSKYVDILNQVFCKINMHKQKYI